MLAKKGGGKMNRNKLKKMLWILGVILILVAYIVKVFGGNLIVQKIFFTSAYICLMIEPIRSLCKKENRKSIKVMMPYVALIILGVGLILERLLELEILGGKLTFIGAILIVIFPYSRFFYQQE